MSSVIAQNENQVARPLKVLVALIKEDLLHGNEAAKQAGMPYYQAAGEKMLEAKNQLNHGEFQPWLKRNFNLSYESARGYMKFAKAMEDKKTGIPVFSSLNDFHRQTGDSAYRSITTRRDWHEPVKANIEGARRDAERLRDEHLTRQQEREAERVLALKLIDIGYKVLAKELHPDKGGSRDTMQRLSRVRDRLKASV